MENENKNPNRTENSERTEGAAERITAILCDLLVADDVVGLRTLKGEYTDEKATKLSHAIAVVVDGMVLTALQNRGLAEAMVSVINEHIKNSRGNPRAYHHLLHLLAYMHRLEVDGVTHNPNELSERYAWIKSEMNLDDIEEQRAELEDELDGIMEQSRLVKDGQKDNQMFA